jgi:hypothetical protein
MNGSFDRLFEWGERCEAGAEAVSRDPARPLREYQQTSINLVIDAIGRGERRIVLQLPTGGGKNEDRIGADQRCPAARSARLGRRSATVAHQSNHKKF